MVTISCNQQDNKVTSTNSQSINNSSFVQNKKLVANSQAEIKLHGKEVTLCGLKFDEVHASSRASEFYIAPVTISPTKLIYSFSIPGNISASSVTAKSKQVLVDTKSFTLNNPVLPHIPLLPLDKNPQICKNVIKYHKAFKKNFSSMTNNFQRSNIINISGAGKGSVLTLKPDLQSVVNLKGEQLEVTSNKLKKIRGGGAPIVPSVSIIIYDDLYSKEVAQMATLYSKQGHNVLKLPLSQLPGLNANGAIPEECLGARERECYHTWADTINDVSPLSVPGLKGFFSQYPLSHQYSKVSYIPGLIRAFIRTEKKKHRVNGVFLIGNDDYLAPFYTFRKRHSFDQAGLYNQNRKLATNIFYAIPDPIMEPQTTAHYEQVSASIWSCINGSGVVTLRPWCLSGEDRHWPQPPLTAYGFAPQTALSRVMNIAGHNSDSQQFHANNYTDLELEDVIPIGRLYTRYDKKGRKDPIVAEYVKKIIRWHKSLPNLNTAIASHGGFQSWVHTNGELDQFQATFGQAAKIYASEMFINSSKCQGRCTYKSGPGIINDLNNYDNRSAFHFTAHGSTNGFQLTYGGPNAEVPAKSRVAAHRNTSMGIDIHPTKTTATPGENLHAFENGTLFGVIFANSCLLSDTQHLENDISERLKQYYGDIDHRSVSEHILLMPNGGAVNLFVNNDVGWGGSDSHYNAKFMQKLKMAGDDCADIGEAVRLTWFDMLKGDTDGAGYYQMMNRQLLGSPFNKIKKRSPACDGITLNEESSNE